MIWDAFPKATGTIFKEQYQEAIQTQKPITYEEYPSLPNAWFVVQVYPTEKRLRWLLRSMNSVTQSLLLLVIRGSDGEGVFR